MCTREEGRERNTYIYSRGWGGGGVATRSGNKKSLLPALSFRGGQDFSQATFIGNRRKI